MRHRKKRGYNQYSQKKYTEKERYLREFVWGNTRSSRSYGVFFFFFFFFLFQFFYPEQIWVFKNREKKEGKKRERKKKERWSFV